MRRLEDKLATLQSRLMTDENHHINKKSVGATSLRRKSAFTLPRKGAGSVPNIKRHSLQLASTMQGTREDAREDTRKGTRESTPEAGGLTECKWTSNLMPEFKFTGHDTTCDEIGHDTSYPQELNPAASLLHSVCLHSRNYRPSEATQ